MTKAGRFVVIEGPKGSGKSTTAKLLLSHLPPASQRKCILLEQPSDTALGRLLRRNEATMSGHAYAMALAADRLSQYEQIIRPVLCEGIDVVMSRYTPSSLVLQRLDGVSLEDIWRYNQNAPAPDALFYLRHSRDELRRRLQGRNRRATRIQSLGTPDRELQYYEEAYEFLEDRGWSQYRLHCDEKTPEQIVGHVVRTVNQL